MTGRDVMLLAALSFTALAAWCDLRTGHIPNRVTLGALAVGSLLQLLVLCWLERASGTLTPAFVALVIARIAFGVVATALVPYLLFLRNGMGGGDVKLLAALGGSLGPVWGLEVELYAFTGMLLFACARLAYAGRLMQVLGNSAALVLGPLRSKDRRAEASPELLSSFKFGPAVCVGTLLLCVLRWGQA